MAEKKLRLQNHFISFAKEQGYFREMKYYLSLESL